MIYILSGIVMICASLCLVNLLVWIWEKLDPPTKIEEVRVDDRRVRSAAARSQKG